MLCDSSPPSDRKQEAIDEPEIRGGNMMLASSHEASPGSNPANPDVMRTTSTSSRGSGGRSMQHPNIHHHPVIHPHHRYNHQRALSSSASPGSGGASTPTSAGLAASSTSGNLNHAFEAASRQSNEDNRATDDDSPPPTDDPYLEPAMDPVEELRSTESQLTKLQELINKLNHEIFKDPQNYTRPPSEYLDVYNRFTANLHFLQQKKEKLEQQIKQEPERAATGHSDSNNSLFESAASVSPFEPAMNGEANNEPSSPPGSSYFNVTPPGSFQSQSCLVTSSSKGMLNDADVDKKPPLSRPNLPKIKLQHPTTLMTSSGSSANPDSNGSSTSPPTVSRHNRPKISTPNLPIQNRQAMCATSASTSPATTPVFSTHYKPTSSYQSSAAGDSSSSPPNNLSTSTSSLSLPSSANNGQQAQTYAVHLNSNGQILYNRSFGDITEVIGAAAVPAANTPTSSLSPSASSATTPTYNPLPSSFLRVYIGTSTAVVEKKPVMLKDALFSKLKSRNLEIDKCVAFVKDSNFKIEWDYEVSRLNTDQIVVAEIGDQIRHSFEKKTFTLRSCDACKKRFLLNVYACSKCDYVMCQRNECRTRSERIVCAPRRIPTESSLAKPNSSLSKPENETFGRPESPNRETQINVSQQILPVNQLRVNPQIPPRDRSRSETELNMFVTTKLSNDTTRPVPKSPSTIAKSSPKNSIYGTIPRKPSSSGLINTPIDDISGSVNEESGSVIKSKVGENIDRFLKPNNPMTRIKPPNRRDSFNSWEIPFKQIKIDMNNKVGSGSFGIVHQGKDFYHGVVAIKFLNVQNPTPAQAQAFRNEVAILKSLRHDCILLFIGCILKPYLAIVTEWCPGSSLYRHLHVEEEHWDISQLIEIAKQTAIGMEYLHAYNILHRDLKSNNIFLIPKETNPSSNYPSKLNANRNKLNDFFNSGSSVDKIEPKWSVKIGDFGLATVKSAWSQSPARTNQPTGSILWMAPEVITQKVDDPYTQKSDVYSYGVVLYELFTGLLPYQHKEQNAILFLVGSGRLKPSPDDLREDTPNDIKDLMLACCQYDRNKRHDFVEINERLKKTKIVKPKSSRLERSRSLPCLTFAPSTMYDDELYPGTPHPAMMNSPLQFETDFNEPMRSNFNNDTLT